ncbi:MAG: haloacid dehalogenase-like hydrolase [Lachnospiraceae bacterium]|nr:haloacid dehalogenase-like hydrolase [Lachnospiraceae bacterium]
MKKTHFKSYFFLSLLIISTILAGCTSTYGTIAGPDEGSDSAAIDKSETTADLEDWTEGSEVVTSIKDYVARVTDPESESYIPPEDRIVVFDLDGTLIGELYPSYFEYMMFIHRALYDDSYKAPEDMKKFAKDLEEGIANKSMPDNPERNHAKYAGEAYKGMTIDELKEYTHEFMKTEATGFNNLTRGDAFYKPMVSLVNYLDANDFICYIVSGSDRTIVRALIEDKLPIPEERVIGMSYSMVASGQGDTDGLDYLYKADDEVILGGDLIIKTIKMNKVSEIAQEIGKVPVLAFGNSSGDESMQQYTLNNDKYESKAFMVLCDDLSREYGNLDKAAKLQDFCDETGIETISMCNDFATIYGDDVTLNEEAENEVFTVTMPKELDGIYELKSRKNGVLIYDKASKDAGFGGYVYSIFAYADPSEYSGVVDVKRGEIKKDDETLYDIVVGEATDVQYDYQENTDGMPESYKKLCDSLEDILKTIKPLEDGKFVLGAGCEGQDLYSEILNEYIKAIEEKWDSAKLEENNMSPEYSSVNAASDGNGLKNIGYAYYDVNSDGVEELLIGEILKDELKGTAYDIYTIVDRKPQHVVSGSGRDRYYALEGGLLCNERSGGADETEWIIYNITPNSTELYPQMGLKYDGYEDKENPWFISYDFEGDEWESISEKDYDDYKSRNKYIRFDFTPLEEAG